MLCKACFEGNDTLPGKFVWNSIQSRPSSKSKKDFFVVFWSAFRVPKHHLRSKPSIHVHLRGKIKLVWSRSEYPVSKYNYTRSAFWLGS
jgi:hypothetical protein